MLSGRLPVNSMLLVVKFRGESKITLGFSTAQGVSGPNPVLFKGQVYFKSQYVIRKAE